MNRPGRLTTLAVTAVAVGGLSGGIAVAQSSAGSRTATPRPAAAEPTAPDTDNVQEGDQTSPDGVSAASPVVRTLVTTAKAKAPATQRAVPRASTVQPGESEGSGESEGADQSDGPGGHQDPPGDVQHEGGANEQ